MRVGRERLRQILIAEGITFQRTKTWKESPDPLKEQKLARIEWLLEHARDRTFAFDEFGPLTIKPVGGSAWAPTGKPQRLRANYHKPHGSRQFYAWYSIGADRLCGHHRAVQGIGADVAGAASDPGQRRRRRTDPRDLGQPQPPQEPGRARVVRGQRMSSWSSPRPTASWANPIEAHFGPLRQFVIANSDHPDHRALGRAIRSYLRWRNTHTRDPEVLDAERRHRAKIRSEATTTMGPPTTAPPNARERSWSEH